MDCLGLVNRNGPLRAKLRFLRSDLLHLLPFPTADSLARCIGPADVLTQAGHEFGGTESRPTDSCLLLSNSVHGIQCTETRRELQLCDR